jgi:hypothetical protein
VKRRVKPHERIAAWPIDLQIDLFAHLHRTRQRMHNAVRAGALAGIHNGDAFTAGPDQEPRIARLPAAQGVENGPIQLDSALVDPDHRRRSRPEIRIVPKKQIGHGAAA